MYSPLCSATFCHFSGNFIIPSSQNFLLFKKIFWLHWVFVAARRLSLVAASRGYSLLSGLLIAVAPLVAEHRLKVHGPQ